jgi:hypothetical protein
VALEMMEPALVMEEKSPPLVDSWAATREPAAMTRMEVNFMVIELAGLWVRCLCLCCWFVVEVDVRSECGE